MFWFVFIIYNVCEALHTFGFFDHSVDDQYPRVTKNDLLEEKASITRLPQEKLNQERKVICEKEFGKTVPFFHLKIRVATINAVFWVGACVSCVTLDYLLTS